MAPHSRLIELRNCSLADGRKNMAIRIKDGVISEISNDTGWENFLNVNGLMVMPGVIDVHVHDRTPGDPMSETWDSLTKSALHGGVTYVAKMPNTNPPIIHAEHVDEDQALVGRRIVPHSIWFGATNDNQREIELVAEDPRICGVKMYMGSSTGNLLVNEEADQRRIFTTCAAHNLTLAVHPEDEELMLRNKALLGRQPLISDHCWVRSTPVEVSAVRRALRLAKDTGCKLHLCHVSAPESVELAFDGKASGVTVTVGVCPHHLFLDDERLHGDNGGFFKMNPPLRSVKQMWRLGELTARVGYVDVIESDHAPHTSKAKKKQEYSQCPSGVPGVETLLPLMLHFAHEHNCSYQHIIDLVSTNPASLLRLPRKGKIEVGYDADLVALDPAKGFMIKKQNMASRCGWTPYHGMDAVGEPRFVIVNGNIVYPAAM